MRRRSLTRGHDRGARRTVGRCWSGDVVGVCPRWPFPIHGIEQANSEARDIGPGVRADVDPQILNGLGSVVRCAAAPEVRALHGEHTGDETLDVAPVTDDVNPLTRMKLIPQWAATAITRRMNAQIAFFGDLADGIADLVDAARQHAARRSRPDAPNEIPLRVAREAARRRRDAAHRLLLEPRCRGKRYPGRQRARVGK